LERTIPSSDFIDGMGCYPIFACPDWSALPIDLSQLGDRLVSLSLVTDPFATCSERDLTHWFDVVAPFKQHYVTDLRQPLGKSMPRRHRRNLAKALKLVQLEHCAQPLEKLDEWCRLYDHLAERHGIHGIRAFSRSAFEKQLAVPGLIMFRASEEGNTVGL